MPIMSKIECPKCNYPFTISSAEEKVKCPACGKTLNMKNREENIKKGKYVPVKPGSYFYGGKWISE